MDIGDLVTPDRVVADLPVADKARLLRELARRAASFAGRDAATIEEALVKRERLGSTGIGNGVALPHARIKGLPAMVGLFIRLERPIDFAAIDDQPVDLVFLLLTPDNAASDHLAALACVSRRLRSGGVAAQLRAGDRAEALFAVLTGAPRT